MDPALVPGTQGYGEDFLIPKTGLSNRGAALALSLPQDTGHAADVEAVASSPGVPACFLGKDTKQRAGPRQVAAIMVCWSPETQLSFQSHWSILT